MIGVAVFLVAFLTALVLVPLARAAATRLGLMDVPGELAIHTRPVARTGGLAIFVGFIAGAAWARWSGALSGEQANAWWGVLIGGTIMALAGLLDDVRRISPLQKFLCQFLAASVAIGLGVHLGFLPLSGLGLALTLLYMVGSANAVNLLDGMDGLAGGVCAIAALSLGLIGAMRGDQLVTLLGLALAGAVLGFLPFNLPRASIFMGDAGSLFLGFTLAGLGVLLADRPYNVLRFAVPLLVLAVPLADTVLALARRFRRRDDLFTGDRDHSYDILARRWGPGRTVLAFWGLSVVLGGAALGAAWVDGLPGMAAVLLAAAGLLWLARRSGVLLPLRSGGSGGGLQESLARLRQRYMHPALLDLLVVVLAFYLALVLRFSGERPGDLQELVRYGNLLTGTIFFIAFAFALSGSVFGLYDRMWRYASAHDVGAILAAGSVATGVVLVADLLRGAQRPIPLSVVLMGGGITTAALVALRYRQRLIAGPLWRLGVEIDTTHQRALIVGAGEAGQQLAWQMLHQDGRCRPVGFVDDDPAKLGLQVHGVRVLGTVAQVEELAQRHQADLVVVAIHRRGPEQMGRIFDACQRSGVRVQVLPDLLDRLGGPGGPEAVRDLTIEDLLGRPPVQADQTACRELIEGRVVLVTGAAGSIGSEVCRQAARHRPERLVALDRDERGLCELGRELEGNDRAAVTLVGDVSDLECMDALWRAVRPATVFHCAAYQDVAMLQRRPREAVKTNVLGTLVAASLAQRWGAECFVFVSTDKAVCPASVLGASKRVGELLVQAVQGRGDGSTRLCAVRFGNALGGRGGVVAVFERQIAQGGPVTLTDPGMKRYFMGLSEAAGLLIQAGALTAGGDLFLLDMGEEVAIADLAQRMIRLRGLRVGEDIAVVTTGARPGEKLQEMLLCPVLEQAGPTAHPAVLRLENHRPLPRGDLVMRVDHMLSLARQGREEGLAELLFGTARLLCPEGCTEMAEVVS